jgi:hypothetical protein
MSFAAAQTHSPIYVKPCAVKRREVDPMLASPGGQRCIGLAPGRHDADRPRSRPADQRTANQQLLTDRVGWQVVEQPGCRTSRAVSSSGSPASSATAPSRGGGVLEPFIATACSGIEDTRARRRSSVAGVHRSAAAGCRRCSRRCCHARRWKRYAISVGRSRIVRPRLRGTCRSWLVSPGMS